MATLFFRWGCNSIVKILLLVKCIISEGRILTIEEFGALPDSQIPTEKERIIHSEFLHSSSTTNDFPITENYRCKVHGHSLFQDSEKLIHQAILNTDAYNQALDAANRGDVIQLVENQSYSFMGGINGVNLEGLTLDFAGYSRFIYSREHWPMRDWSGGSEWKGRKEYVPCIDLKDSIDMVITCSAKEKAIVEVDYQTNEIYVNPESGSGGIIDGHGKKWWDAAISGVIDVESRPRLIYIRSSMNITVENVSLVNSPYWTFTLEAIHAEVHHVNILIDRNYQRQKLINNTVFKGEDSINTLTVDDLESQPCNGSECSSKTRKLRHQLEYKKFHFPDIPEWLLQPQNLNTDGFDLIGEDINIHDCIVLNDDDSVAIKPPINDRKGYVRNGTKSYKCTQNIKVENMVLTGFGASIGSVGPHETRPCVDNVVFKNISMPGTGKGIYIKSNKSDCNGKVSSSITNILYDSIHIKDPFWWPIWIGPQQQHEPHQYLDGACSLQYPIDGSICPTQGCTKFENITLRNVFIEDPMLSPGVILGNSSNPMKNILFDNVTMTVPLNHYLTHGRLPFHEKSFPYAGKYQCENVVNGICKNCNPVPDCFV